LVYLGKISFSLYLWHWPTIVILRWTSGIENIAVTSFALLLTLGLSIFSYHFVEQPIRNHQPYRNQQNSGAILIGLLILAFFLSLTVLLMKSHQVISLSVTKNSHIWYASRDVKVEQLDNSYPGKFSGKTVFVIGDSHAEAYARMINKVSQETGIQNHIYSQAGCPVINLTEPTQERCPSFIDYSLGEVKKLANPGDVILFAGLRIARLSDQKDFSEDESLAKQYSPEAILNRKLALAEAENIVEVLSESGVSIVIDAPKPVFRADPYRCSDWFNKRNPSCAPGFTLDRTFFLAYRKPIMDSINQLTRDYHNVSMWDPSSQLCPLNPCSAFDGDIG
jgi:hypothetical protein